MTIFEMADYLVMCDDEAFAEIMVIMYLKHNEWREVELTGEEMRSFDCREFGKWMERCMEEIVHSEETCANAWWKKE